MGSHKVNVTMLSTLAALFMLMSCTGNRKQEKMHALAGMYKLIVMENVDSTTGEWKEDPWAAGGDSYIIYDGLGHMAVEITPKDYKAFKWITENQSTDVKRFNQHIDTLSVESLRAATKEFAGNYVYFANVRINDTADIVSHDRIAGTIPVVWGTAVHRTFRFSGDTLILQVVNGNRRLKWARMK
jgi:hypothetical protein